MKWDWVNWKSILTSIASLIMIGLLTTGWRTASAEYTTYKAMKVEVQASSQQIKQMQQQQIILKQIAEDVAGIKKNVMTVTGRAMVRDFGDTACLRINTKSRAAMYADMDRARVTNMSSSEMPSVVVKIEGKYQDADENFLAIMSARAGSLIDALPNRNVAIRIEPVEEK